MRKCLECQWHYAQNATYLTCRKHNRIMEQSVHACPELVLMNAPYPCDLAPVLTTELEIGAAELAEQEGGAV